MDLEVDQGQRRPSQAHNVLRQSSKEADMLTQKVTPSDAPRYETTNPQ